MKRFTVAPTPWPTKDESEREYLLDMLLQLARLARSKGELQIAVLIEAILAVDSIAKGAN